MWTSVNLVRLYRASRAPGNPARPPSAAPTTWPAPAPAPLCRSVHSSISGSVAPPRDSPRNLAGSSNRQAPCRVRLRTRSLGCRSAEGRRLRVLPQLAFVSVHTAYIELERQRISSRDLPMSRPEMTPRKVIAHVRWRTAEEGGRKTPPKGSKYTTVAGFDPPAPNWPQEAWSVVVEPVQPDCTSQDVTVVLSFLMGPVAPEQMLTTGVKFQLFEGKQVVADGEITDDNSE